MTTLHSKYVVIDSGLLYPIVFSDMLNHAELVRAFGGCAVGAGFCYIDSNRYVCYGESTSLNVPSRGEVDSLILNTLLGCVD
jgi:hypothetical protein